MNYPLKRAIVLTLIFFSVPILTAHATQFAFKYTREDLLTLKSDMDVLLFLEERAKDSGYSFSLQDALIVSNVNILREKLYRMKLSQSQSYNLSHTAIKSLMSHVEIILISRKSGFLDVTAQELKSVFDRCEAFFGLSFIVQFIEERTAKWRENSDQGFYSYHELYPPRAYFLFHHFTHTDARDEWGIEMKAFLNSEITFQYFFKHLNALADEIRPYLEEAQRRNRH